MTCTTLDDASRHGGCLGHLGCSWQCKDRARDKRSLGGSTVTVDGRRRRRSVFSIVRSFRHWHGHRRLLERRASDIDELEGDDAVVLVPELLKCYDSATFYDPAISLRVLTSADST